MNDRTLRLSSGQQVSDLFRYAIGLEEMLRNLSGTNSGNFPPHNIERLTENVYVLTLAVAGFSRDDITMTLSDGVLNIRGSGRAPGTTVMPVDVPVKDGGTMKSFTEVDPEVLYQGIAMRDFQRQFRLGEHVEVKSAVLKDGLLIVTIERQLPQTGSTIKIDIG